MRVLCEGTLQQLDRLALGYYFSSLRTPRMSNLDEEERDRGERNNGGLESAYKRNSRVCAYFVQLLLLL